MALNLDVFTCLVHLSQDLYTFALNLGQRSLLYFSLLKSDLFSSMSMFLLIILFSLDQSTLKQVEPFVLKSLDVIFSSVPLSDLLVLH